MFFVPIRVIYVYGTEGGSRSLNRTPRIFESLQYGAGGETRTPTGLLPLAPKASASANFATPAYVSLQLEAWTGIEPVYKAFAELCLATWLPRHFFQRTKKWIAGAYLDFMRPLM